MNFARCILLLLFSIAMVHAAPERPGAPSSREAELGRLHIDAYTDLLRADEAFKVEDFKAAFGYYKSALAQYKQVRTIDPKFKKRMIEFRLGYCADRVAETSEKMTGIAVDPSLPAPSQGGGAMKALTAENTKLKSEIKALQEEVGELEKHAGKNDGFEKEKMDLENLRLREQVATLAVATNQVAKLSSETKSLQQKLQTQADEGKRALDAHQLAVKELQELRLKGDEQVGRLQSLEKELAQAKASMKQNTGNAADQARISKELDQAKQSLADAASQQAAISKSLARSEETGESLQQERDTTGKELGTLQASYAALQKNHKDLMKGASGGDKELALRQKEIEKLQAEGVETNNKLKTLEASFASLEKQRGELMEGSREAGEEFVRRQKKMDELQAKHVDANTALSGLKQSYTSLEKTHKELMEASSGGKDELLRRQQKFDELNQIKNAIEQERDELAEGIDEIKTRDRVREEAWTRLEKDHEELLKSSESLSGKVGTLEADLADATARLKGSGEQDKALSSARKSLEAAEQKARKTEADLAQIRADYSGVSDELNQLKQRHEQELLGKDKREAVLAALEKEKAEFAKSIKLLAEAEGNREVAVKKLADRDLELTTLISEKKHLEEDRKNMAKSLSDAEEQVRQLAEQGETGAKELMKTIEDQRADLIKNEKSLIDLKTEKADWQSRQKEWDAVLANAEKEKILKGKLIKAAQAARDSLIKIKDENKALETSLAKAKASKVAVNFEEALAEYKKESAAQMGALSDKLKVTSTQALRLSTDLKTIEATHQKEILQAEKRRTKLIQVLDQKIRERDSMEKKVEELQREVKRLKPESPDLGMLQGGFPRLSMLSHFGSRAAMSAPARKFMSRLRHAVAKIVPDTPVEEPVDEAVDVVKQLLLKEKEVAALQVEVEQLKKAHAAVVGKMEINSVEREELQVVHKKAIKALRKKLTEAESGMKSLKRDDGKPPGATTELAEPSNPLGATLVERDLKIASLTTELNSKSIALVAQQQSILQLENELRAKEGELMRLVENQGALAKKAVEESNKGHQGAEAARVKLQAKQGKLLSQMETLGEERAALITRVEKLSADKKSLESELEVALGNAVEKLGLDEKVRLLLQKELKQNLARLAEAEKNLDGLKGHSQKLAEERNLLEARLNRVQQVLISREIENSELKSKSGSMKKLQKDNKSLSSELNERTAEIAQLNKALGEKEKVRTETENDAQQLVTEIEALRQALKKSKATRVQTDMALNAAQTVAAASAESLQALKENQQQQLLAQGETLTKLKAARGIMQDERAALDQHHATLKIEVAKQTSQLAEMKGDAEAHQVRTVDLEKNRAELVASLSKMESDYRAEKETVTRLQKTVTELAAHIEKLEKGQRDASGLATVEVGQLKARLLTSQTDLKEATAEAVRLSETINATSGNMAKRDLALTESSAALAAARKKMVQLQTQLDGVTNTSKTEWSELQAKWASLNTLSETMNQQLVEKEAALKESRAKVSATDRTISQLEKNLVATQTAAKKLEAQLQTATQSEAEIKDLETKLRQQLADKEKSMKLVQGDASRQNRKLKQARDAASQQVEELTKLLQKRDSGMEAMSSDLAAITSQSKQFKTDNALLKRQLQASVSKMGEGDMALSKLMAKYEGTIKEHGALQSQVNVLQESLTVEKARTATFRNASVTLTKELAGAHADAEKAQGKLAELTSIQEDATLAYDASNQALAETKKQLDASRVAQTELGEKYQRASKQMEGLKASLASASEQAKQWEGKASANGATLADVKHVLRAKEDKWNNSIEDSRQIQQALSQTEAELKSLKKSAALAGEQNGALQKKVKTLGEQWGEAKGDLAMAAEQRKAVQIKLGGLVLQLEETSRAAAAGEKKLTGTLNQLAALSEKKAALETNLTNQKASASALNSDLGNATESLARAENDRDNSLEKLAELKSESEQARQQLTQSTAVNKALKNRAEQMEKDLSSARQEQNGLAENLSKARAELAKQAGQAAMASKVEQTLKTKLTTMSKALEAATSDNLALSAAKEAAEQKLDAAEKSSIEERTALTGLVETLGKQIADAEKKRNGLKKAMASAHRQAAKVAETLTHAQSAEAKFKSRAGALDLQLDVASAAAVSGAKELAALKQQLADQTNVNETLAARFTGAKAEMMDQVKTLEASVATQHEKVGSLNLQLKEAQGAVTSGEATWAAAQGEWAQRDTTYKQQRLSWEYELAEKEKAMGELALVRDGLQALIDTSKNELALSNEQVKAESEKVAEAARLNEKLVARQAAAAKMLQEKLTTEHGKVTELEATLKKLELAHKGKVSQFEEQQVAEQKRVQDLTGQLSDAVTETKEMEQSLADQQRGAEARLSQWEQDAGGLKSKVDGLETELGVTKDAVKILAGEKKALAESLASTSEKAETTSERLVREQVALVKVQETAANKISAALLDRDMLLAEKSSKHKQLEQQLMAIKKEMEAAAVSASELKAEVAAAEKVQNELRLKAAETTERHRTALAKIETSLVAQLKEQDAQSGKELARVQGALADEEKARREYVGKIEEIRAELASRSGDIAQLKQAATAKQEEMGENQRLLTDKDKEIEKLKKASEALSSELSTYANQPDRDKQLKDAQKAADEMSRKFAAQGAELKKSKRLHGDVSKIAESKLSEAYKEINALKSRASGAEKAAEEVVKSSRLMVEGLQAQEEEAGNKIGDLTLENQALIEQVQGITTRAGKMEKTAEAEITGLRESLADVQAGAGESRTALKALTEEKKVFSVKLAEATTKSQSAIRQNETQQKALLQSQKDKEQLVRKLDEMGGKLNDALHASAEASAAKADFDYQLSELMSQRRTLSSENESLVSENVRMQRSLDKLTSLLDRLSQEATEARAALVKQRQSGGKERELIAKFQAEKALLGEQQGAEKQHVARLQAEITQLTQKRAAEKEQVQLTLKKLKTEFALAKSSHVAQMQQLEKASQETDGVSKSLQQKHQTEMLAATEKIKDLADQVAEGTGNEQAVKELVATKKKLMDVTAIAQKQSAEWNAGQKKLGQMLRQEGAERERLEAELVKQTASMKAMDAMLGKTKQAQEVAVAKALAQQKAATAGLTTKQAAALQKQMDTLGTRLKQSDTLRLKGESALVLLRKQMAEAAKTNAKLQEQVAVMGRLQQLLDSSE